MRKNMAGSGAPALFLVFLHKGGLPGFGTAGFFRMDCAQGTFFPEEGMPAALPWRLPQPALP